MKYVGWAQFSTVEIANEARVRSYATNGLINHLTAAIGADCCTLIDEGYVSPADDPAPWYDATVDASGEFYGLLGYIRVDSVVQRSVTQHAATPGATIGRARARSRIVAFELFAFASTDRGMAYGEAWLRTVLAGGDGCQADELVLLQACDASSYRTLRQVGLVDGPVFGQIGSIADCRVQSVSFQIAAGVPHLLQDGTECLPETVLVSGS